MNQMRPIAVTAALLVGLLNAGALAEVRVFMSRDNEHLNQPRTGSTSLVIESFAPMCQTVMA